MCGEKSLVVTNYQRMAEFRKAQAEIEKKSDAKAVRRKCLKLFKSDMVLVEK